MDEYYRRNCNRFFASIVLQSSQVSPEDEIECSLTVTDGAGASATETASATIGNQNPIITSLSLDQFSVSLGDTIECRNCN